MIIHDEKELEQIARVLREEGFTDDRIAAYIDSLPKGPNREERYFIAFMRNGLVRTVKQGAVLETNPKWREKALQGLHDQQ